MAGLGRHRITDIIHFIVGYVSSKIPYITIFYLLYQVFEKEDTCEKICDYIEFILGFLMGLADTFI